MSTPNHDQLATTVNLREKLSHIDQTWQPKIVGELNGQHVKLAKLHGHFMWHAHPDEDEMFLVIRGELTIRLRDRDIHLREGEFFIVERGVEHLPVADEPCEVLLFEPASTLNTGNVRNERTIETPERL